MAERRKAVDLLSKETIREIAERYVTDYESYTMDELARNYKLSSHNFKEVIRRAIVELIVTYQVAEAIRDKSEANQHRHFQKGRPTATGYYKWLFNERLKYFKANVYDPEKAPVIAKNYLHSSINSIAAGLGLSPRETFYYIWKGACYYFTDTEYHQFREKLKKDFPNDKQLYVKLAKLDSFRKTYTEAAARLEIATCQFDTLDDTISSEDEVLGRRELIEDEIAETNKLIRTMRECPE